MSAHSNQAVVASSRRSVMAIAFAVASVGVGVVPVMAADSVWSNGTSNSTWDTTSANWDAGFPWSNAAGNGGVFDVTGASAINVAQPISLNSMWVKSAGYSFAGAGSLNVVAGTSTQTTAVFTTDTGVNTSIAVPINSNLGFQKIGAGTLTLSGSNNITGGVPLVSNGKLRADYLVGGVFGTIAGGTLSVASQAALPATSRVSIGNAYLNIGSNDITLAELTFTNQMPAGLPWNTSLNANNGVIGSGKLKVNGDINIIGVNAFANGNTIAVPLDLGGKEQVIRAGALSSLGLQTALMLNGPISNGSLTKTIGITSAGIQSSVDGMSLNAANTYTGPTRLAGGVNFITNTNATTSVASVGIAGAPSPSNGVNLSGANGSILAATAVSATAGATFTIDNNISLGASGLLQPNTPAAQNNNRLNDSATLTLRDGAFNYRGFAGASATETFGTLSVTHGHNAITLTPNGGGSVTVTASGNLSLGSRATLLVNPSGTGNVLGNQAKLLVSGTVPAADATGILSRVASTADFLTYNATTGLTPFTGYSTDFATANTNVSIAAPTTVSASQSINGLKRSGTNTLTINSGQTLAVNSGMMLTATGTSTYAGDGTVAFGSTPGVFFGTHTFGAAGSSIKITGTNGLIAANGTVTFNATSNLSGLTGVMDVHGATVSLGTNDFPGTINIRAGQLTLATSQTAPGLGAIRLGAPESDSDLTGTVPTLAFGTAGAGATFNRDVIVDNGSTNVMGEALGFSIMARLSPLSNATGSQTFTGNFTLNSPVNLQGGGGTTGTGATLFAGSMSGPSMFMLANGRAEFTNTSTISNAGGFTIGGGTGFTAQATFRGTGTGTGGYLFNTGNNNLLRYESGSLMSGPITVGTFTGLVGVPTMVPLETSTINNQINANGALAIAPAAGITATLAGPITGVGTLAKQDAGILVLTSLASSHKGDILVDAGTLRVNGALPDTSAIFVRTGGRLEGVGSTAAVINVASTGTLAPGNSIGTFMTGSVITLGSTSIEIDAGPLAADLIDVTGSVSLGGSLDLSVANIAPGWTGGKFLLLRNDDVDPVSGVFATINGIPSGYLANVDYGFGGTDALGRIGSGNDVAITIALIPEPTTIAAAAGAFVLALKRRRA
jgi:fibronectin-binding autotransporter adhesin